MTRYARLADPAGAFVSDVPKWRISGNQVRALPKIIGPEIQRWLDAESGLVECDKSGTPIVQGAPAPPDAAPDVEMDTPPDAEPEPDPQPDAAPKPGPRKRGK